MIGGYDRGKGRCLGNALDIKKYLNKGISIGRELGKVLVIESQLEKAVDIDRWLEKDVKGKYAVAI